MRAVEPRGSQHDVAWIAGEHGALAGKLTLAVDIERGWFVRFNIRRILAAIENIVRRDMDQGDAASCCLGGKPRWSFGVHGKGGSLFALCAIDVGIGGGIDDNVPTDSRDYFRDC